MSERRPKKLIEVALPLEAINRASGAEKLIHVGTTSNLHAWWARRPLAACRAVAFASLVDDPGEYLPPDAADEKRRELFSLIEQLVSWDANNSEDILRDAKREIEKSTGGQSPVVVDPFCGSGTIPVEALRLGLDAVGVDLNPVAAAISKALVEVPAAVSGHPSISPGHVQRLLDSPGFEAFRADLDYYSMRTITRVRPQIEELYSETYSGTVAPIAWLWCRTAKCPNPGCKTSIPLLSSLWLSKTKNSRAFLQIEGRDERTGRVTLKVIVSEAAEPGAPTIRETGAICPVCNAPIPFSALRDQGRAGTLGFQMNAYVTKSGSLMKFHPATIGHEAKALAATASWFPEAELPEAALGFRVPKYGLTHHRDLYLERQLAMLSLVSDSVEETIREVRADAGRDAAYANAVAVYIALFFDRFVQTNNALVRWFTRTAGPSKAQPAFDKQTVQMVWDFAEANPLADSTGGWSTSCKYPQTALGCLPVKPGFGQIIQGDSGSLSLQAGNYMFCTDPPYFDNIGYADLSDFFYVWLRKTLRTVYPDVFQTLLVPKSEEIIADKSRHSEDKSAAQEFFYDRMSRVLDLMRRSTSEIYPATIFYAFKQEERNDALGTMSTGWERMLQALVDSQWMISGTWPIRTEHSNRPRGIGSNALASSIVLVCRPRPSNAVTATRRDFLNALRVELPEALRLLQRGNIAPVDLAQAAIGPGMAVYTRYARVLDAQGNELKVRPALALINQTLDEVLAEQEGDFDVDTRWALAWFEQYGFADGEYGVAETLSKAKNTSIAGMVGAGIVAARAGKVRLLQSVELALEWDPETDHRLTVWEIVHHLIRRLEVGGESAAAVLMRRLGAKAELARELPYRLYTVCERKNRAAEALSYNGLVQSWPEISRLASEVTPAEIRQATMFGQV